MPTIAVIIHLNRIQITRITMNAKTNLSRGFNLLTKFPILALQQLQPIRHFSIEHSPFRANLILQSIRQPY